MSSTSVGSPEWAAEARAVRRSLAEAGDRQVLQVLQLVENLPDRSDADRFLAPIRDRLRMLRPARRLRLVRLMFHPLNLVIVEPKAWRTDVALIPRTALTPLASLVDAGLGAAAKSFERAIGAIYSTDLGQIRRVGAELWPLAARLLAAAEMPPSWTAQGLPAAAFVPLRDAVAFLLTNEARLVDLRRAADQSEVVDHHLAALLGAANQCSPLCWGMLLTLLLQRFPESEAALRAALTWRADKAGEAALDRVTASIEETAAQRGLTHLPQAADEIAGHIVLLDRLAAEPSQRRRATELRAFLLAGCAARFQAGLQDSVADRLASAGDRESLDMMEQDARNLRRMEVEARRLGGGAVYDQELRATADGILAATHWSPMERIRLVEILGGTPFALEAMRTLGMGAP